jgi:HD-like signal output (HDOD) protein
MNWFKRFTKKPEAGAMMAKTADGQPENAGHRLSCTAPLATENKKLPLATLKKFVPLRDMDDDTVAQFTCTLLSYAPKSILFTRGQQTDAVYYLLKGSVQLRPDCENDYTLTDTSPLANLPLNSGKRCGATAIATTKVEILAISQKLINVWTDKSRTQAATIEVVDFDLPEEIAGNRFFNSFTAAYHENKLSLPSLPHVALKLKEAMRGDISINEAVEIIQIDAPIVTKLIQVANSALYAPVSRITNGHSAVTWLGLEATRNLVTSISMKQLFQSKDPKLMKQMRDLWKNSLYVSSLSFVLAQESASVDPEDALLAGLICDIGTIPILHFAEQYPDEYPDVELQAAIPVLSPPVGSLVLHTLGFPEELTQIPRHAEDWFYESANPRLNLTEIVILAKLHSHIGSGKFKELPYINSIPAYVKMSNGKLDPDFSLNLLHKAQQRINAAMSIFS